MPHILHPWAIVLGALACVLPLVVHWLTRPRPVRLPLSTIRFVQDAVRQRRARHRVRDWLILALRVVAVLLLAWGIARPLAGNQAVVAGSGSRKVSRVIVLDVSQSMAAQAHGIQLFERARPVVAKYLAGESDLEGNLIVAGALPRAVFGQLSTNFRALREELSQAHPRPELLNLQAALNLAGDFLAKSGEEPGRRRELVIVSDFQRSNWTTADFSAVPADTHIQLESVAPPDGLANVAVLRAGVQGRVQLGREIRLDVEIGNYSAAARRVEVDVRLGQASYRLTRVCPAGGKSILSTDFVPREAGWQSGDARLIDMEDALAADNARAFAVEIRPAPVYALVTRQPATARPSSSYYMERALAPALARPGKAEGSVIRLDPDRLDQETLLAAEVLVLDHPGRIPDESIRLLASFVRRGRGLLYVLAEPADAINVKRLEEAAAGDWHMPVDFVPAASAAQRRRDLFLTEVRPNEPPFNVFGEKLSATIASLRFAPALSSRRRVGGVPDDILATYSDRSACLVVSPFGAGTLAILNADLTGSNLPASSAFVPLIGELLTRLLGRSMGGGSLSCGEPFTIVMPTNAGVMSGLRIVGPDGGSEAAGQLAEEGGAVVWRGPGLTAPGIYRVLRGDSTVFAVGAGIPQEESDLTPLDPAVLTGRLAGNRSIEYRTATGGEETRDQWWAWLIAGCTACLLVELLALRFLRT